LAHFVARKSQSSAFEFTLVFKLLLKARGRKKSLK
jgi:hypothetical protein